MGRSSSRRRGLPVRGAAYEPIGTACLNQQYLIEPTDSQRQRKLDTKITQHAVFLTRTQAQS